MSMASHVLGGEIRYEHLTGQRYRFMVDVYRDCGSCKLNGHGGGSSKDNCDDIGLLYVTRSGGGSSLASIQLSRLALKDISPVCNSDYNLCKNADGLSGIEKHTFTGVFDFGPYRSDQSCEFDVHLQISSRSAALTNGMASEKFHNFTKVNTCGGIVNNSPVFQLNPVFRLEAQKIYRLSAASIDVDGDSVAYHLVSPMTDFNKPGSYVNGFNQQYPLSCYCPFGTGCQPFPGLQQPVGFSLDPMSGQLVFIPVKASEVSLMCIELVEYRKINGQYIEIGRVRRDVQLNVSQSGENNAPQIQNKELYKIKAGIESCVQLDISDEPAFINQQEIFDTVSLNYHFRGPNNHRMELTQQDTAPFKFYQFCVRTPWADTLKTYQLILDGNDGHCPFPLHVQKSIALEVLPVQRAEITVEELPCNLYRFAYRGNIPGSKAKWQIFDEHEELLFEKTARTDSFYLAASGKYNILLQLDAGAGPDTFYHELEVVQNGVSFVKINVNREVCYGDSLELKAIASNGYRLLSNRWFLNGKELNTSHGWSTPIFENGLLRLVSSLEKNGFRCTSSDTIQIEVRTLPEPFFMLSDSFCEGHASIHLDDLNVSLSGGEWQHFPAGHLIANTLQFPNEFYGLASLRYSYTDADGCRGVYEQPYEVLKAPELSLEDRDICLNDGMLSLNGLIRGGVLDESQLDWTFGALEPHVVNNNGARAIALNKVPAGEYELIAGISDENGCQSQAKSAIRLQQQVNIQFPIDSMVVCDMNGEVDLIGLSMVSPAGGVFVSSQPEDILINNILSAGSCGPRTLTYTYDQFGCYATQNIELRVVCEPDIHLDLLGGQFCDLLGGSQLVATPAGGTWFGEWVDHAGILQLPLVNQPELSALNYRVEVNGCAFQIDTTVWLHPSPDLQLSPIPEEYCEGQELTLALSGSHLQNIHIRTESNWLDTTLTVVAGRMPYQNTFTVPFNGNGLSGIEALILTPGGSANCPVESVRVPLKVHMLPRLGSTEIDEQVCAPYQFSYKPELINYKESEAIYRWNYGDGSEAVFDEKIKANHLYDEPGTYKLTLDLQLLNGCFQTFEFPQSLKVFSVPKADFVTDPEGYAAVSNPTFTFTNRSTAEGPLSYFWSFGTGNASDTSDRMNPVFTFAPDTTEYMVKLVVTGDGGCTNEFSKRIVVGPDILLFIPNAFSPDNKGPDENAAFSVQGQNVESVQIKVYDRWGMKVFHSESLQKAWDGTSDGRACTSGVYTYHIRAKSKSGMDYEYTGTLHLLR